MRRGGVPLAQLARLQRLAVLERRRGVELACAESDRREAAAHRLDTELAQAERDYAASHADGRMCLSRLTLAAAIVNAGADALRAEQGALAAARSDEAAAGAAWLQSRYRADWFEAGARDQQRRDAVRRGDRADEEARMLRLTRAG